MKRLLVLIFATVIVGIGVQSVAAQDSAPMTEAHIERIRANCVEAQSVLYQLHASDALLRVNRGQLYESISTKLMAPFNSRMVLNKFEATSLTGVTISYERELAIFRTNYQQYEEAMSKLLRMNCTNQPVAFYDGVNDTRAKRKKVHDSTVALQGFIKEYETNFEVFAKKLKEGNR